MKYFRAFLQFIGFCTCIALVGIGTFLYIDYSIKKRYPPVTDSTVTLQQIPMTPLPAEASAEEGATSDPLPEPTYISTRPRKAKATPTVAAPIQHTRTTGQKAQPVVVEKTAPRTTIAAKVKPTKSRPRTKSKKPATVQAELPPSILQFRATDNSANPRTGKGIVNPYETTDLEREAIKNVQMRQLQEAAEKIRNPPVWKSGLIELFGSNK